MKIIKAYSEIICRIHCAICDDREWFQFEKVKDQDSDYAMNFEYCNTTRFSLAEKLKFSKRAGLAYKRWVEKEKFIFKMMPITLQELDELYANIFSSIESLLSENELQYIRKTTVASVTIPTSVEGTHKLFFESKGGLTISTYVNTLSKEPNIVLGYTLANKKLKNWLVSGIITPRGFFNRYHGSLTKSETIDFMAAINHLLNTVTKTQSGFILPC